MTIKSVFISLIVPAALLLAGGLSADSLNQQPVEQPEQARTEHNVLIKLIDDEWRVVLAEDESRSNVIVRRGDRIRWIVEGSDASFQFSDEKVVGHSTRTVRDGRPLVLAITNEASSGSYPYSVFIHKDQTFARGQSPPRIIVQ